jgi:hypothetical protein
VPENPNGRSRRLNLSRRRPFESVYLLTAYVKTAS